MCGPARRLTCFVGMGKRCAWSAPGPEAKAPSSPAAELGAIYQFSGGAGTGLPCKRFDTLPPWMTVHHIGRLVQIWMASINRYSSLWRCAWTVRKSRAARRSNTAGNWLSGLRTV